MASVNGTIPTDGLPGAPTLTVFSVTTDGAGAAADRAGRARRACGDGGAAPAPADVAGHGRLFAVGHVFPSSTRLLGMLDGICRVMSEINDEVLRTRARS